MCRTRSPGNGASDWEAGSTGAKEKKEGNQEVGRNSRIFASNAERIKGDQVHCVRIGDFDRVGQISRIRREPNTLFQIKLVRSMKCVGRVLNTKSRIIGKTVEQSQHMGLLSS